MRIKKATILGYGKLSNLEIGFGEGLNIVYGANESGKSTLQLFIKAMLYGQRKGKTNGWSEKERFRPWQGGTYGGTLEYSLNNNEEYRIWRDFETGQVKVYDSILNDITDNFQANRTLGTLFAQEHLGIDQELFESTCFAAQTAIRQTEQGRVAIAERIRSIMDTGSERTSYVSAKKVLEKVLIEEVGTERTGQKPINKIKEQIEKLKERKKLCKGKLEQIHVLELGLRELNEIKHQIKMEAAQIKEFVDELENQGRYQRCKRTSEQIDILKNQLQQKISEFDKTNAEIPMGVSIFDSEVAQNLSKIDKEIKNIAKRNIIILCILGALVLTGGAIIKAIPSFWPWAILICLAGIGVGLITKYSGIKQLKGEEQDILGTAKVQNIERYFDKKREISFIFEKKEMIEQSIELIKNQIAVLNEDEINESKPKQSINIMNSLQFLDFGQSNLEEIETNYKERIERIRDIGLKGKELETEIRVLSSEADQLPSIEEEIALAYEEKEKLEEYQYCIRKAIETMQACSEEIKNEIMPDMIRETGRVAKTLTGHYCDIGIDSDGKGIMVSREGGEVIPVSHMSGGTIDQLYLAMRLSLCNVISSSGEYLPFILDEAFVFFDQHRLKAAVNMIIEMCKEKQILTFTCRESEASAIEALVPGAKMITLC
jgi:uncharacterized protein YhaN